MAQCLKCKLDFGDHTPDYCPVCQTICYTCPWCGRVTDASQPQCTMLDCGRPIKYLRMTPDLRDIMRLRAGEIVQLGNTEVTIEKALYASQRVTVYRGQVTDTKGWRKPEPNQGETVVVREVVDDFSPRVQAVVAKLQSLKHQNIVRTFAAQADEERCCYYMLQSWVGDRSLASVYLQESGGQAPGNADLAGIAMSLSKAVEYLHSNGIIHCDITPFNVLLTDDGTPVLSDFGLASLANDPGKPEGYTPGYSPLEMYPADEIPADIPGRNWGLGAHTDRFMLGATLLSVACGTDARSTHLITRTPVLVSPVERMRYDMGMGGSPQASVGALVPGIDPGLASWIETLLSVNPEARFKSDHEMVKRAQSALKGSGRRRRFRLPGLGRLRKPLKYGAIAAVVFMLFAITRHSYTLTHSASNFPGLILADLQGALGMDEAAIDRLCDMYPPSAEVYLRLGNALEGSGKLEEALKSYKESQSLDSAYAPAKKAADRARSKLGTASLQRGLQLYRAKEYYLADKQLTLAVHYGCGTVDCWTTLARIAERRGEISDAASYYDAASRLLPTAVRLHYKSAYLFLDSGNLTKAYHHAVKARDLHASPKPDNDVSGEDIDELLDEVTYGCLRASYLDIARAKSAPAIFEKMVWLTRASNLKPSADVYLTMGRYHERLGDISSSDRRINHYEQAVSFLKKAKKLKPGSPAINNILARCMSKAR